MPAVQPIPDGYPRVIPYLSVADAPAAIDFYTSVLGAEERMRMVAPGGKVGHAELAIGDSIVMLADEWDGGTPTPVTVGGSPVTVMVYVEDVDAMFDKAIAAGGEVVQKPSDQFYGDRSASFIDPFGHRWHLATHIEDVSEEEMQRRMTGMMDGG